MVYDRRPGPMMIVECKRPDVELTKEVLEQALRYDMVLDVKYLALTNGNRTIFCERLEDGSICFLKEAPTYLQMLGLE